MRSNVEHWKRLQHDGYFETHPCYKGIREFGGDDEVALVEQFVPLSPDMIMIVIGCGYGRETLKFATRVRKVYGIDVSPTILNKAAAFLSQRGVTNFTPVTAESYKDTIPSGIDLVFSIVVMQHLTRDLVLDYFQTLANKLSDRGCFVVQFLELMLDGAPKDAELQVYEPSVSWTTRELFDLAKNAGLQFVAVRTHLATPTAVWHWAFFKRGA